MGLIRIACLQVSALSKRRGLFEERLSLRAQLPLCDKGEGGLDR